MKTITQSPKAVVMVRPHQFLPNPETAADNGFQNSDLVLDSSTLSKQAYQEVTDAAQTLTNHGVKVHLFEDESDQTPDSVFPNNWFSTHADGSVALYPMYCENRRLERRKDIIDLISDDYSTTKKVDYSYLEDQDIFLEGTGSMVLDHQNRLAYAVRSKRMDCKALQMFCDVFDYQAIAFNAEDKNGVAVYHTNVLMCVATDFVMIALDMIKDPLERSQIKKTILQSKKEIIELSESQIEQFAGNALELEPEQGKLLAISQTAVDVLTPKQIATVEKSAKIVALKVKTIELAGGSVRCMLAGIHLEKN